MYPAGNGDAFLVSSAGTNVLIDGGYANTFDQHVSHDLHEMSRKGECIDLLIATHIDADHISGLIRFLAENRSSDAPQIVSISNIWHNSLRSLTAIDDVGRSPADRELLDAISRRGHPDSAMHAARGAAEISARQGSSLARLIREGGYKWNDGDGTTPVALNGGRVLPVAGGSVCVIGPPQQKLDELMKWWKGQLRGMGYRGPIGADAVIDDAFEFVCERSGDEKTPRSAALSTGPRGRLEDVYEPDISVTNGSSIATIIELGGVRFLMLGDAWAEDALQSLRDLQSKGHSMVFDAIKISHHGSLHNTSPDLLRLVDAPKYFVSSNGATHDHPDIEVLRAIVDRPAPFSRDLYFNYSTPASSLIRAHRSEGGASFSVTEGATDWIVIEGTSADE